jgi:dolichyl-phosphate-mannose-protein mannosyltransferase
MDKMIFNKLFDKLQMSENKLSIVYKWEYIWLLFIVVSTLLMHFSIIYNPNALISDELWYVRGARSIITFNYDQRPEHPPLGKLFVTTGIRLFGDNPLGWRFFSVIFGTIVIVLFYFICRKLGLSRSSSSIATYLLTFENMTFVQSSVAMLDVYLYTFMLASFLLYLNSKYIFTGIFVGLSSIVKINGLIATPTIFLHWLFTQNKRSWKIVLTVISALLSFFVFLSLFDSILYWRYINPLNRINEILKRSVNLTFSNIQNDALSRPWEWILKFKPMLYFHHPLYIAAISPTIWVTVIPVVAYMFYRALKRDSAGLFGISWFVCTYFFWIILSIITNRASYIFYFYPTIGSICLGLGLFIDQLLNISKTKSDLFRRNILSVIVAFLIIHFLIFVIFSPVFT